MWLFFFALISDRIEFSVMIVAEKGAWIMSDTGDRRDEIQEAIDSGNRAVDSLKEAQEELKSAGRWGVLDAFGGNIVTGIVKHHKVNDAEQYVDEAKADLQEFRDDLWGIRDIEGLDVSIDGFLTFADFAMDGIFADMLVQSKIEKGKREVADAIERVEDVIENLEESLDD